MIEKPDEMRCLAIDRQGYLTYLLEPMDSEVLSARATEILRGLDASGALIGVLPELTVTPALLKSWSVLLRETPRPRNSRLRIVLVGSGHSLDGNGDAPRNRAYLLDRYSGLPLGTQDKLFGFSSSGEELATWGYADMARYGALDEELTRGASLEFFETSAGRIVVLICEDLARETDIGPRLAAFGTSLILAPVLDRELKKFYWEHRKGMDYADRVGSAIVIANSLATHGHKARGETDPRPTCLGAVPGDCAVGASQSGSDVVLLSLGEDGVSVSGGRRLM
jgi:predicted amidohydrolase